MRPRRAALGLSLIVCLAALALGVLHWLHALDFTAAGYVAAVAVFAAVYVISQTRR
jgi:hypothetical protein